MADQAEKFLVGDNPLACLACGHKEFFRRFNLMNTQGLTFLKLDWANKDALCAICSRCGFVHWFAQV